MFSRSSRRRRLMEQELLPHLDSLFRYALSVTRDRDQAEELTQETLARAVEHFEKYTPGTNARAWLFRILINLHINQRRARRPEAQLLEGTEPRWEPETQELLVRSHLDPERNLVSRMAASQIREALDRLPEDFRTMVILADLEGFSYREIADQVDCPIGTVMSRLHRGRRLLRQHLLELGRELGLVHEGGTAAETPEPPAAERVLESLDRFRARRDAVGAEPGLGG